MRRKKGFFDFRDWIIFFLILVVVGLCFVLIFNDGCSGVVDRVSVYTYFLEDNISVNQSVIDEAFSIYDRGGLENGFCLTGNLTSIDGFFYLHIVRYNKSISWVEGCKEHGGVGLIHTHTADSDVRCFLSGKDIEYVMDHDLDFIGVVCGENFNDFRIYGRDDFIFPLRVVAYE